MLMIDDLQLRSCVEIPIVVITLSGFLT